ncbi:HdeD family acid-resistance protein [Maritalea sp.]|jgi:uncharacterized membrane protein HdeD (DUF308 family)|uniref:HdeD family acid-resistance protein n=1 Tax=Maritalea sp. TaxID=2003361 RepID=UPI0039E69AA6
MRHWIIWLVAGLLSVIAGLVALANPLAATIAVEQLAGWAFLVIGLIAGYVAFQDQDQNNRIWGLIASIGIALIGVALFANPLAGILSLTLLVAILFLVTGVSKIFMALPMRSGNSYWTLLLSGGLSVVLAIMIFANFPQSAASILGIVLSVELISNGASLVAIAWRKRQTEMQSATQNPA